VWFFLSHLSHLSPFDAIRYYPIFILLPLLSIAMLIFVNIFPKDISNRLHVLLVFNCAKLFTPKTTFNLIQQIIISSLQKCFLNALFLRQLRRLCTYRWNLILLDAETIYRLVNKYMPQPHALRCRVCFSWQYISTMSSLRKAQYIKLDLDMSLFKKLFFHSGH
jgi:hypothetical protein